MSEPKRRTLKRKGAGGRAVHDVGGLEFGPIDREEHDLALWEKRTDAMLILLRDNKRRVLSVDSHRRTIEDYGQQEYDRTTYYEKWIRAIRNLLVEQDVLTREEVEARMAKVRAKHAKAGRKSSKDKIPW
jgi:Nitrile hydratase beta subunit